jgi:hypothetical protein
MPPNWLECRIVLSESYNRTLLCVNLLKWDLIVRMVKLKGPKLNSGWVYNETVLNVTFSNTIFVIGLSQA